MRPTIWPGATSKETPSSATMPPKRTDTARTLNRAPGLPSATVRNAACATMTDAKLPPKLGLTVIVGGRPRRLSDCRTATLWNGPRTVQRDLRATDLRFGASPRLELG